MANIPTVHDKFVRSILSDTSVAIDYFKSVLPEYVASQLDFDTLERSPGSYVSNELEHTISDVVYRCQRIDGKGAVDICLLLEHKSYRDNHTPLQIGSYLFSGYRQQVKQRKKQLVPIIPILFYHGRQKWDYWTLDRLFDGLDESWLAFLPNFDYVYNDLSGIPDEEIKAVDNMFLAASLLALKHAFDKQWLKGNFAGIMSIGLSGNDDGLQEALLLYYLSRVELTPGQAREVIKELPDNIKERLMSTYELLKAEGKLEGKLEGKAEVVSNLIQKLGLSNEQSADVAEVSVEFVEKIRIQLSKKKK